MSNTQEDGLDVFNSGGARKHLDESLVTSGVIRVKTPSAILINPKFPHNVGAVLRLASAYGLHQVWYTGNRVPIEGDAGYRLPREERMRGYKDVDLYQYDYPLDLISRNCTPVAVEVRENAEELHLFDHPQDAVYVFGPEDGSIPQHILRLCHRFVIIPTMHCLNLGTAVATVLYDRGAKLGFAGGYEKAYGDLPS